MKEKKIPVKVFLIKITCDCGGELVYSSSPSGLSIHLYQCNKCKKEERSNIRYPRIIYEE